MSTATACLQHLFEERRALEDYQGGVPRWCKGCGDNAILAAVQRLCRDEGLRPEKTVFVSGIGCSSRLPHYMNTYGFHGIHGRALPIAEGIKLARPDLHVFVNTGDGDCCSIGAAHWIHAIRYNMNLTVLLHDNHIYGLTKKQASPTSPIGTKSNTTPRGSYLDAMSPLTVTLGVQNVSFVAQAVDWIPESLFQIVTAAYRHHGLSFVRILQRCPEFVGGMFEPWVHDPQRMLMLTHENGIKVSPALQKIYSNQIVHDPVGHQPRPRDRLERRPDSGGHPLPQPRGALLRGPAACGHAAHHRYDPLVVRGGTRQVHRLAVMTMDKQLKAQVVFHLTGRHAEGGPGAVAVSGLRPALMAAYRDLESLRHDFPVIFTAAGDEYVQSLTAAVDTALRAVAPPGVAGEALRRRALKVEREICRRVAAGERGTVAELWDRARTGRGAARRRSVPERRGQGQGAARSGRRGGRLRCRAAGPIPAPRVVHRCRRRRLGSRASASGAW